MGLDINASHSVASVKPNFFINPIQGIRPAFPRYVAFKGKPDSFDRISDFSKYASEDAIKTMIKRNPKVREILADLDIPEKVNMGSLYALNRGHLAKTREAIVGIIANLPEDLKEQVDKQALLKAAVLHDFGKVMIPRNILNKDGKLNPAERKVMENHAILGYEMLKTTELDEETLRLIKYHHQNPDKTGYPMAENDFDFDINAQILSLADKYSAFREDRSYKKGMNPVNAIRMVKQEVAKSGYNSEIYKALANYAQQESIVQKVQLSVEAPQRIAC